MNTEPSPFADAALIKHAIDAYEDDSGPERIIRALAEAESARISAMHPPAPELPFSPWKALESIAWAAAGLAAWWIYWNR